MTLNNQNSAFARSFSQFDWLCMKKTNEEDHMTPVTTIKEIIQMQVASEMMVFKLLTINLQSDETQTEV